MDLADFRTDRNGNPYGLKKRKYNCDYGDGEHCHYKEHDGCIYNKSQDGQFKGRRMTDAKIKVNEVEMSETRKKQKVEFIESYWTGGEIGSDYQWNDNHGVLVRCKDCWKRDFDNCPLNEFSLFHPDDDWFCADGERKD